MELKWLEDLVTLAETGSFSRSARKRNITQPAFSRPVKTLSPEILVADEPVSALDVSVQAQVFRLLDDIRDRFNLAMVFIAHDLRVAAQVCDRVAVMRHGRIVEEGTTGALFAAPENDYTRELLGAGPASSGKRSARAAGFRRHGLYRLTRRDEWRKQGP